MAHNGSIPAIPTAARAGGQIVLFEKLLPLITGELGTLIGVHMDFGFGFAPPDSHQQGLQRQIGVGAPLH